MSGNLQTKLRRKLIKRQYRYEQQFLTFESRDYIASMQFCVTCNGNGCACCSGHGWRHTSESIAFGLGLNAMAAHANPYSFEVRPKEWRAFGRGKATRSRLEVHRIQAQFGLAESSTEIEAEQ